MSGPYWSGDGITLYHGDCREIDAWLEADVLVTDPPYGIAYDSRRVKHRAQQLIAGDNDPGLRDAILEAWGAKPAIVFGSWRVSKPKATRQVGIWDKGNDPGMGDLSMPWGNSFEEFYILGDGFTGKRGPSVITSRKPTHGDRPNHPTPKPPALMERLIVHTTGVVADPFAGSGSTLVACRDLGRQAIGVELEERYCEIAARRLDQGVLDFGDAS